MNEHWRGATSESTLWLLEWNVRNYVKVIFTNCNRFIFAVCDLFWCTHDCKVVFSSHRCQLIVSHRFRPMRLKTWNCKRLQKCSKVWFAFFVVFLFIVAVNTGTSLVLSSLLSVLVFAGMQMFSKQLGSTEWLTILGGFLGSVLFICSLTVSFYYHHDHTA